MVSIVTHRVLSGRTHLLASEPKGVVHRIVAIRTSLREGGESGNTRSRASPPSPSRVWRLPPRGISRYVRSTLWGRARRAGSGLFPCLPRRVQDPPGRL